MTGPRLPQVPSKPLSPLSRSSQSTSPSQPRANPWAAPGCLCWCQVRPVVCRLSGCRCIIPVHRHCANCRGMGPWTRQVQPWGLVDWCDGCWLWQRGNAWRMHNAARRAGTLVPPSDGRCRGCAWRKPLVAHHTDYNAPFKVRWLCSTCHGRAHRAPIYKV
jgi:hypothetical protein